MDKIKRHHLIRLGFSYRTICKDKSFFPSLKCINRFYLDGSEYCENYEATFTPQIIVNFINNIPYYQITSPEDRIFETSEDDMKYCLSDCSRLTDLKQVSPDKIPNPIIKKGSFIYIVRMALDGKYWYKIGKSSNPVNRLTTLRTSSPFDLQVYRNYLVPTSLTSRIEANLHIFFKDYRLNGEWFNITEDQVKDIDACMFAKDYFLKTDRKVIEQIKVILQKTIKLIDKP